MTICKPDLWDHQFKALQNSKVERNLMLTWEMGTGKTRAVVEIVSNKIANKGPNLRVLVLSPKAVIYNWKREFEKYAGITDISVLEGTSRKKVKTFQYEVDVPCGNRIVTTNFETLNSPNIVEMLHDWGPEIVVIDESHRCKGHNTKRSKATYLLAGISQHTYLLSGTPVVNTPLDLFQQFKILEANEGAHTFGRNYFKFRSRVCHSIDRPNGAGSYFKEWILRDGMDEYFQTLMENKTMRVKKDECLNLPPLIKKVRECELGKEQAKAYKEMRKEFITFIDKKSDEGVPIPAIADLVITRTLRLQQITTGFIKLDNGEIHSFDENPRIQELRELLAEVTPHSKVIVWACWKENYKQIRGLCDELGIEYAELHGGIKDKEESLARFINDEDCRVVIANQQSAGVGVDGLQVAKYAIYFSKNYNYEFDTQSEARNYRGGSEVHSSIVRIDLVSRGTIDEAINEALNKKQKLADFIVNIKETLQKEKK